MKLLEDIRAKARQIGGTVVLPEGDEPRMMHAAEQIIKEGLAKVIIVGDPDKVKELARREGADISGAEISDPKTDPRRDDFATKFWQLRKHKGLTLYQAKKFMEDPLYWGAMLVREGFADAAVAGAKTPPPMSCAQQFTVLARHRVYRWSREVSLWSCRSSAAKRKSPLFSPTAR